MILVLHTATLVVLVLANGGRYDWAYELSGLLALVHCAALMIHFRSRRVPAAFTRFSVTIILGPWLVFALLFGWALLNPSHQLVYDNLFSPLLPVEHWTALPTTPNPERSRLFLQHLLLLMATAASLVVWPMSRRQIRSHLAWVFRIGVALGLFGALQKLGRWPFESWIEFREPLAFGTFFYKNHWAYFALLCAGIGTALFRYQAGKDRAAGHFPDKSLAYALSTFFLLLTIPLSEARGALLAAIPLVVFFLYTLANAWWPARRRFQWFAFPGLATLGIALMTVLAAPQIERSMARSERQLEAVQQANFFKVKRLALYRDSLKMFCEKPIWGWGLGSFIHIHPIYAGSEFYRKEAEYPVAYEFAHGDYLQALAEMGFGGCLLLLFPVGWFFLKTHKKTHCNHPMRRPLVLASASVCAAALVDFALSCPAIALGTVYCGALGYRYALLSAPAAESM